MLNVYNSFVSKFVNKEFKVKIRKPIMFKSFVKNVMNKKDVKPFIKSLQKYIKENNLLKGTIDFTEFHRYNQFMAMKGKKKEKLVQDDSPMMDLSESCDSSSSSHKSISSGD